LATAAGAQGERRAAILRAAAALLAERKDVAAVGVDEIAARAGVAKATLYRYFPTKAALVRSIGDEHGVDPGDWQTPDRREQIIEAAMRLIRQRGLRATSMEQIAEAAGISSATIYWYFAGKDQLAMAMADRCSPLEDVRRVLARGADGDPADDLRALVRLMLQIISERFEVVQACMGESWASPQVAAHVLQRVALPVWETLGAYFEAHVAAGRLVPAPALPRVLTFAGAVLAFMLARRTFGPGFPIEAGQMVETLVDTFLLGAATATYRDELDRRAAQHR
jgi:AcrR family transcriptional regulator